MIVRDDGYEPVRRDARPRRVPPADRAVGSERADPVQPDRDPRARPATVPTPRAVRATAQGNGDEETSYEEPEPNMGADIAYRKVTMTLPEHILGDAQRAAKDARLPFSTFVARAVWNETLRRQLETARVPELPGWLDDAEADEAEEDQAR